VKQPVVQVLNNFPALYGTRRFITMFTRALHLSLSLVTSIQSTTPHPISLASVLIITTHIFRGLPSGLFPYSIPIINPHELPPSFVLYALPIVSPGLGYSNYTRRRAHVMKLLIMQLSPPSCYLISLRFKYSLQRPVLKRLHSVLFP
jgi:hypothetical protein